MDVQTVFREALREATDASVGRVAEEAGYSRSAFDQYSNRRAPSRAAMLALAATLRRRAERLERQAERLEEAADEAAGGSPP